MWGFNNTMSKKKSSTSGSSKCDSLLSWFGFSEKKITSDFVVFDDGECMDAPLLWPKNGSQEVTPDDYLEFVPGHERGLADSLSGMVIPMPEEEQLDYNLDGISKPKVQRMQGGRMAGHNRFIKPKATKLLGTDELV